MFDPDTLIRENISRLRPYSSARNEFTGTADVYLDANENAFGSPVAEELNRYPDPLQSAVKVKIAALKGVRTGQIFVGNGSDEAIDLLFRIFCEPRLDNAIICPPTYGMYRVAADINDVAVREVPLTVDFQLDTTAILDAADERTKLIFVCSPNNPSGNAMRRADILSLADGFAGIVVVDEAYIDFSSEPSLLGELDELPNLVVLQTFSKAWGMAGARVGLAFASEKIVNLFNRVKPPYNVSRLAQDAILAALDNGPQVAAWIGSIAEQRHYLEDELAGLPFVETVYPSDANFLLVKMTDATAVYRFLLEQGIVVRDRSNVQLCGGCLRITVGTDDENVKLIGAMRKRGTAGGEVI